MTGALEFAMLAALAGDKSLADAPCPLCAPAAGNPKKRVLRIWREAPDFATWSCARCGEHGWASERGARRPDRAEVIRRMRQAEAHHQAEAASRTKRALAIWERASHIAGTLGEAYLARRGLRLGEDMGHALRFVPALYCTATESRVAALVALFRDIRTDEPRAVHRIYIAADGSKIGRFMLGPVKGAAVKLDADAEVTHGLFAGEGVETCLAARQLGFRPAWAMGSKGGIAALPVLPGVEAIGVLGENDAASAEAIEAVRSRWQPAGREVLVLEAEAGDINDALMRGPRREAA
jgi:hypothetical protein